MELNVILKRVQTLYCCKSLRFKEKPEWSYPENLEFLDLCSLQIIKMNHTNKNILTASAKVRWLQWHL